MSTSNRKEKVAVDPRQARRAVVLSREFLDSAQEELFAEMQKLPDGMRTAMLNSLIPLVVEEGDLPASVYSCTAMSGGQHTLLGMPKSIHIEKVGPDGKTIREGKYVLKAVYEGDDEQEVGR